MQRLRLNHEPICKPTRRLLGGGFIWCCLFKPGNVPQSQWFSTLRQGDSVMPFEIFMHTWDEISGRKVLAIVPTEVEADDKLDEMSERFPHAYIDFRSVPE